MTDPVIASHETVEIAAFLSNRLAPGQMTEVPILPIKAIQHFPLIGLSKSHQPSVK